MKGERQKAKYPDYLSIVSDRESHSFLEKHKNNQKERKG
jgi:hypothetical protein